MSKFYYRLVPANAVFIIFSVMMIVFSESIKASDELQPGDQFKIIRSVYVMAVYDNVSNKQISRETARAYLYSQKLANRYFTAFQSEVPAGTIMTIIGPAPKVWRLPFLSDRYFVRLKPDVAQRLDVVLALNSEFKGDLDGLNPELFSRMHGDAVNGL
mgnify:CR=1 FL=1